MLPPCEQGDQMRVLYVSSGLDPRTGGTATAAVSVCLAARRAGIEADLAYPVAPGTESALAPAEAALRAAGVGLHPFPFATIGGRRAIAWGIAPKLNDWVEEEAGRYDLIHAHSVWVWTSVGAVRAAGAAGRPVVIMPHEGLTHFDMGHARAKPLLLAKSWLRGWYLDRVTSWVLSSELERQDSGLDRAANAVAIPHPVFDELAGHAEAHPPPPLAGERPIRVGFMGRFHPKKHLDRLIAAVAEAPGVELHIAGDGPDEYRAALQAQAAPQGARVVWHGFLSADAKPGFLRQLDLLAMPSAYECFGLVGAEALSQGVPVLASPQVGIAEDLHRTGCGLVVSAEISELAAALRDLSQSDQLATMAARAQPAAIDLYSFGAHGRRLAEHYRQVLGG